TRRSASPRQPPSSRCRRGAPGQAPHGGEEPPMTVKERALDARLPRRRRRVLPAYLPYVLPLVLLLLLVNLYPTIYEIVTSFTSRKLGPAPGEFVGLDNFRRLTADPRFWNSIWVTLRLLLYALPAEMIAGTALALLLHASPFRRAFLPLLLLP